VSARPAAQDLRIRSASGGLLEFITTGSGLPSTVFGHGVDGSIATTRPFGSGVIGSRTFLHFRGYGASLAGQGPFTYAGLEEDLRAVADHVGATQAFGVSMGAGALCSLLAHTPLRFARLVFALPAVLDRPRTDLAPEGRQEMTGAALGQVGIQVGINGEQRKGASLAEMLSTSVPLKDRAALGAVTAPALVIAQEEDPAHPVWVAEQLTASLPNARLKVLPPGGILVRHRDVMRDLIVGFLSGGESL